MSTKHYDVIVLGENLAGLITASLLAARRYSVAWIRRAVLPPQGFVLGPSFRHDPLLTPGLFERPALAAVSRELSLGHKLRSIYKPANPLFQVVDASHRLDVSNERVAFLADLQREFGPGLRSETLGQALDNQETLNALIDKLLVPTFPLKSTGIKQWFDRRKRLKDFEASLRAAGIDLADDPADPARPFEGVFAAAAPFLGSGVDGMHPIWKTRRVGGVLHENLYRVGQDSLEDLLIERLIAHGGQVVEEIELTETEAARKGFRFATSKNTLTSEFLVCAFDHFLLPELFPQSRAARRYPKDAARLLKVSHVVVKVSFLVDHQVIPEPMAHTLILTERLIGAEAPLLIQRDPLLTDNAELERLDVYAWTPVENLAPERLRQTETRIIERVKAFIPFLSDYARKIYLEQAPSAETLDTPWALAGRRLGYQAVREKGLFRGLPFSLPLRHAFLAGSETTPELGLEGDFFAGLNLSRLIAAHKPHKDELR